MLWPRLIHWLKNSEWTNWILAVKDPPFCRQRQGNFENTTTAKGTVWTKPHCTTILQSNQWHTEPVGSIRRKPSVTRKSSLIHMQHSK